jgi:hypothetical protein
MIDGGGNIIFDGGNLTRFFYINSGKSLTLNNLTLTNGYSTEAGAIFNNGGALIIGSSTFNNNRADNFGGAIWANGGTLSITDSVFSYNDNDNGGGAIFNNGVGTIVGSSFEFNSAENAAGAIFNGGTLTITRTSFHHNNSGAAGGAIANVGTLISSNDTYVSNSTHIGGVGGALYNDLGGSITVNHNTFASNTASLSSSTIYNVSGTVTLTYSIINDNGPQCSGTVNVDATNLSRQSCGSATVVADLMTRFLTANTVLLDVGSPALDNYPAPCAIEVDKFGASRPQWGSCDVGAVEMRSDTTLTSCNFLSLDNAVYFANLMGGVIDIDCEGIIEFPYKLTITKDIAINGNGGVIFDGGNNTRLFDVANGGGLAINTLTLQNSHSDILSHGGGAIFNDGGTITINNATFINNIDGGSGGAIGNFNGAITISNSTFHNNSASDFGGAIENSAIMSISNCVFTNNTTPSDGGGIINYGTINISNSQFIENVGGALHNYYTGVMTIEDSIFRDNDGEFGGAILSYHTLNIINSVFISNHASSAGGAISAINDSTLTIDQSIFTDNTADSGGGAIFNLSIGSSITTINNSVFSGNIAQGGGAIRNGTGLMVLTNSTFHSNVANEAGGAIYVYDPALITISSSTLSNNTSPRGTTIFNQGNATITHSILSGTGLQCEVELDGIFDVNNTNLVNSTCDNARVVADLGLGTFNGQVIPLMAGSPAINDYPAPCEIATDQLGTARPQHGMCDVGAVEMRYLSISLGENDFLAMLNTHAIADMSYLVVDFKNNQMDVYLSISGETTLVTVYITNIGGNLSQISILQMTHPIQGGTLSTNAQSIITNHLIETILRAIDDVITIHSPGGDADSVIITDQTLQINFAP